jgi:predicted component of type VI protein secretion system
MRLRNHKRRLILGLSLFLVALAVGCEAHVTTDAPPPAKVDVQVNRPPAVDVDVSPKPGGTSVDVDVKRP